jgi:hypothetical protein
VKEGVSVKEKETQREKERKENVKKVRVRFGNVHEKGAAE